MKYQLVYPMAFYFLYIFGLGIYNFMQRFKAIKSGELSLKYYKVYDDKGSVPYNLLQLERHLDHQFQLPLYFFVTLVCYIVVGSVNTWVVVAAWLFVVSRLIHSYIHLGSNNLRLRALVFFLGVLIVALLWLALALHVFTRA